MPKMKAYIDIPILSTLERYHMRERLSLSVGLSISWSTHTFSLCHSESRFPNKKVEGAHYLSVSIGISYFSVSIVLYKPKKWGE